MSHGHHHESFSEGATPLPSERSTGLVFAAMAAVAAVLLRTHAYAALAAGLAAVVLGLFALAWPHLLAPMNRAWFRFALLLNRIISPAVMLVIYAVVIVPAGLLMQRLRDPLRLKSRGAVTSYWIERSASVPPSSMRDQF